MILLPTIDSRVVRWDPAFGTESMATSTAPVVVQPAASSLANDRKHRWAKLWEIRRKDGVILRFTDHSSGITFEGNFFTPAGGFSPSATRGRDSLRGQDFEAAGMITSDAITEEDLRAGRYRGAQVYEYLADWLYPLAGAFRVQRYIVSRTRFTGQAWNAECGGLTEMLRATIGTVYGETCRNVLGDELCRVDMAPLTVRNAVVTIVTGEKDFRAAEFGFATAFSSEFAQSYFEHGVLTWIAGNNSGFKSIVNTDAPVSTTVWAFSLFVEPPFEIQPGDTFDVQPGCRRTKGDCKNKFNNINQFAGYGVEMPGNDKLFEVTER